MVLDGKARLIRSEKSRTVIRLSEELVKNSQFPFQPGDELVARAEIATKRLIIEKKGLSGPRPKARK